MLERINADELDIKERIVNINRVAKVVKGGRTFRFSVLVVVGDENGHVGAGTGKAAEIPDAVRKAIDSAKKNMINVPMVGTTIAHEIIGEYGAGRVLLKPAGVLELAGIRDIRTKSLRSNNPNNLVNATIDGLKNLKVAEEIATLRGKTVEELMG